MASEVLRATVADNEATPRNNATAPTALGNNVPAAESWWTNKPSPSSAMPTSVTTAPSTTRRPLASAPKPTSGRIAATGGMRLARHAGTIDESNVTRMPTARAAMIVRGLMIVDESGNPAPMALNSAMIPLATRAPKPMPRTEASAPTPSDSAMTIRRI